MRRKSTRNAAKSSPEKSKKAESPARKTRRSKRRRKSTSTSDSEDDTSLNQIAQKIAENTSTDAQEQAKSHTPSDDENVSQSMWTVTTSDEGNDGEIHKLKICLTRPASVSPDKVSKRRRHKSGSHVDDEECANKNDLNSKSEESSVSQEDQKNAEDNDETNRGKGKSKTKTKSKIEKSPQLIELESETQSEINTNVQVTAQSPTIDIPVDNENVNTEVEIVASGKTDESNVQIENDNDVNEPEQEERRGVVNEPRKCDEASFKTVEDTNTIEHCEQKVIEENLELSAVAPEYVEKVIEETKISINDKVIDKVKADIVCEETKVEENQQKSIPTTSNEISEEKSTVKVECNNIEKYDINEGVKNDKPEEKVNEVQVETENEATEIIGIHEQQKHEVIEKFEDTKAICVADTDNSDHKEPSDVVEKETVEVVKKELVEVVKKDSLEVIEKEPIEVVDKEPMEVELSEKEPQRIVEHEIMEVNESQTSIRLQKEPIEESDDQKNNEDNEESVDKSDFKRTKTTRKNRKWGRTFIFDKIISDLLIINTDVIKTFCPNIELLSENEIKLDSVPPKERRRLLSTDQVEKKFERKVSIDSKPTKESSDDSPKANEHEQEDNTNIIALNRKISIVDDTASKLRPPPSPAKNPVTEILFITNLVRPFTLKQLKELLERTGKIRADGFWTDRIKSKCYVHYETVEEAEATRNAIHGVHWPIGNGKKLIIDFATEEDMENAKNPPPPPPVVVPEVKIHEKENQEPQSKPKDEVKTPVREKEREPKRVDVPVREWDLGKEDFHREQRSRSRDKLKHRRMRRSRSPTEDFISRKQRKMEESVPQKLMDDLFQKTKAMPIIFWHPLSPEQIATKQQQRLLRMAEHKRRMEENSRGRGADFGRGGAFRRRYD